jgi:hypothetical protein
VVVAPKPTGGSTSQGSGNSKKNNGNGGYSLSQQGY